MIADSSIELGSFQANEKPVILIVDDSRVMRVSLKKALSKEYTVVEAADGEEGWQKLQQESTIQVVFSDLSMPKLDGFGFLERIRQSDIQRIRDVPFIVITGNGDSGGMHQKVLSLGATDLIGKPFKSVEIRARAQAHVVHQRKLSEAVTSLEKQATLEPITGLLNQRYFSERAAQDLSFATRHKNEIALLRLHIDQLSQYNTQTDGAVIEEILLATAEILKNHTRCEDIVAHYGDGKFAVLLPATNADGAKQLASRIAQDVMERRLKTSLSASIGVAVCEAQQNMKLDDLMNTAEQRLAAAMAQGGNCVMNTDAPAVSAVDEQSIEASRALSAELEAMRDRVEQLTSKLAELEVAKSTAIEANKTLQAKMDDLQQRVQAAEQAQQAAQAEAQQGLADQQAYEQLQQQNSRLQTTLDEADKRVEVAETNQQKASQELANHQASLEHTQAQLEQQLTAVKEEARAQTETTLEQMKAQHQQELAEAIANAPAPSRTWLYMLMLIVGAAAGGAAGLYFSGNLF